MTAANGTEIPNMCSKVIEFEREAGAGFHSASTSWARALASECCLS